MAETARLEEEKKANHALRLKEQALEREKRAGSRDPGANTSSTDLTLPRQETNQPPIIGTEIDPPETNNLKLIRS
ncbi:uncharacterized protein MELLADRAFT_55089 [Melampsora larici-populina 98AG31]|uniref:Uncharacterized protein n=1 Tax=Melampsora larici-populina (strain 98AG31 / pathotype 3-4-7) TaxID=747676 RepID=F4R9V6_MELLP|nr:uncharacterized protein MELLADRAFT_55089 [Melampsora larici-populina 98AG31]EGG10594.1 hypothetical protein MELLADRAFT_55089 [Melampsora larici-populina 98AG31]